MVRRFLWGALALTPAAALARFVFHVDDTVLFVLAALALVPLAWLTLPVAIVLILVYLAITIRALRRHSQAHANEGEEASTAGWSLRVALGVLAAATLATALISEILVHSLESFAHTAGLSEFF